jgi:hypothetical protein
MPDIKTKKIKLETVTQAQKYIKSFNYKRLSLYLRIKKSSHLIEHSRKVVRILAPGHIAHVVRLEGQDHLLLDQGVRPAALLVVTCEEVAIAPPAYII